MAPRKIFRHFLRANFFMFILLISNHTVFLVQFGVNLHLWVFQKAEITLAEAARAISAFWKTHSCKLIPNWTRNRMITYTNLNASIPRGLSYYLHSKKKQNQNSFLFAAWDLYNLNTSVLKCDILLLLPSEIGTQGY